MLQFCQYLDILTFDDIDSWKGGVKMKITDVRIRKLTDEGKMKSIVSVTFDDEFVVHDIKVIEGRNGLFVAMPSRKMGEGDFRDIAHPLTSETRNRIKDTILEAYEKALAERNAREAEIEEAGEAEEEDPCLSE